MKKRDAPEYPLHLKPRQTGHSRVMPGRGFDVHGDIIQKPFPGEAFQYLWKVAVGIQLDQISHLLYFFQKDGKIRLKGGFSPGDAYAGKDPFPFLEEAQDLFLIKERKLPGMQDKIPVLTEGTAEIAAARENGSRYTAGKIQ